MDYNFTKPITTDRVAELLYKYSKNLIKKTYSDQSLFTLELKVTFYAKEDTYESPESKIKEVRPGNKSEAPVSRSGDEDERQKLTSKDNAAPQ